MSVLCCVAPAFRLPLPLPIWTSRGPLHGRIYAVYFANAIGAVNFWYQQAVIIICTAMKRSESAFARQTTLAGCQKVDIGRRQPTIPSGIVTKRLGQLKTLTHDNGSVIQQNHGNSPCLDGGGRTQSSFAIPASRSTVCLHATSPRSQDKLDVASDVDWLLTRRQTKCLSSKPGPRACRSYDNFDANSPAATTEPSSLPPQETMPEPKMYDEQTNQPSLASEHVTYWANGDGVLDMASGAHICHSCGKWISFEEPCASCGHAFCSRCIADTEEESTSSQIPTMNSEVPSSSTAPRQPSDQFNVRQNEYDSGNYSRSNESQNHIGSMSSSSRSVPRAKTLSSLFLSQPARHCLCCIARRPSPKRQTVAALPGACASTNSSSYSGSSTATHATAVSNLRLPENPIAEEDLRPAALRPHRSTDAKVATQLQTRSSDPYIGRRLMRPHPQQPSPEVENWPNLRPVPEFSSSRPNAACEETPWGRDSLRKVSKPATGEPKVYQKPSTKPEWVANLRKVRRQSTKLVSPIQGRQQPQDSPLDRPKQERVYCDRNRSVSVRPSERVASSNYEEPLPLCDHGRILTKSPSLASRTSRGSLRQVESSSTRNRLISENNSRDRVEQRPQSQAIPASKPRPATFTPKDARPPSIMKAPGGEKIRDQHSCH
ncbi:hypothetical protein IF1G_02263 [Cordyceps javanica]|uniref:Uncharacterized protein n=1 Tax=Cordyceps javanica TaxID=43265 RepID=A0A545VEA9_9HYPO|nr:hypothetical protein IF1G_02263 [Cordyceps javanica]